MKNYWDERQAKKYLKDPLDLRVYTSRLLGRDSNLVLHGGGNTSVKKEVKDDYGQKVEVLYVKGSGWDLETIETQGFSPVKMEPLLKMAEFKSLTDSKMVALQRAAMLDPYAPNPSVEAILHAIIPYKFVDHTHADSVVTVTNTPNGRKRIEEIYGDSVIVIPYVMPGFILARKVYELTRGIDWSKYKGMILMNHGVFTFDDDGKKSYEKMIRIVAKAEKYLNKKIKKVKTKTKSGSPNLVELSLIRNGISKLRGEAVIAQFENSDLRVKFSKHKKISSISQKGPLTPDHVIRTKRIPIVLNGATLNEIDRYSLQYMKYFKEYGNKKLKCLDTAPRWGVWKNFGTIAFGRSIKENQIISDITEHTIGSILDAEKLGGWRALSKKHIFDVEYWDLEQAKLKAAKSNKEFQGKVVIVTGAASGIGKSCVENFVSSGAVVCALDIDKNITSLFNQKEVLALQCDLTKSSEVVNAVEKTVLKFGGIDVVVSNAGIFPAGEHIENLDSKTWEKSLAINLTSHKSLIKTCIPYLKNGIDPTVIIIASKNVPAPGPGASAYSVAKAGLTQLARIAALELGKFGVRVNVLHPNQVFDTSIWTDKILKNRARHYGLSVEEYKKSNLLNTCITSANVADLVVTMASKVFSKTTGAQVPIDGGNERVI